MHKDEVTVLHVDGPLKASGRDRRARQGRRGRRRLASHGGGERRAPDRSGRDAHARLDPRPEPDAGFWSRRVPWSTARRSARLSAGAGARPQEAGARAPSPVRSRKRPTPEVAETAGVAGWTNRCRELVDAPANEMTPAALASAARRSRTPRRASATEESTKRTSRLLVGASRPWPAAAWLRLGSSSSGTSRRARSGRRRRRLRRQAGHVRPRAGSRRSRRQPWRT